MEQFLLYAKARYLKLTLLLSAIFSVVYILYEPFQPHNGGTWLGYTLGTISALLILWLMYLGRRKRNYFSTLGTVKGWLSAHVYLGTGLLLFATLHTGFQFGYNIHTFTYALMCFVIFSGFYGTWAYIYLPRKKRDNLQTLSSDEYFLNIESTDKQIRKLASGLSNNIKSIISSAIDRTELGGGVLNQLRLKDRSCLVLNDKIIANAEQLTIIDLLVTELSKSTDKKEVDELKQIIDLFGSRQRSLKIIRTDIKVSALLKIWLFFHIPVSFALLAALIAHILSVFIYW